MHCGIYASGLYNFELRPLIKANFKQRTSQQYLINIYTELAPKLSATASGVAFFATGPGLGLIMYILLNDTRIS